ncbi:hypothetical protein [Pseudonocardia sp. NPDC046786]|uniref:hypothetical protein n=1 Tax=Pseudonocardia sp. NPDC046786 TaxID=3155471 RepID=UPI0033FC2CE8
MSAVPEETVRALAGYVSLPLDEDRLGPLSELLGAWIPAAETLSARMRSVEPAELEPVIAFTSAQAAQDTPRASS